MKVDQLKYDVRHLQVSKGTKNRLNDSLLCVPF